MNESIDSSCGNLPRERHQRDQKAESTSTGVSIDDFNTSEREATIGITSYPNITRRAVGGLAAAEGLKF
jgi:hypothetical protein